MSRSNNTDKSNEFWETDTTGQYVIEKIKCIFKSTELHKGSKIKLDYILSELKLLKETLEVIDILTEKQNEKKRTK